MAQKHTLVSSFAFFIACLCANAFAQNEPPKLAIYVSGASDTSINKVLGNKILAALVQSGKYAETANSEALYGEFAKNQSGIAQISQIAVQHGASFVCAVNITEAFGVYSIFARIIEGANSQVLKVASADSPLSSFNDLAKVSDELAVQLLAVPTAATPAIAGEQPQATRVGNKNAYSLSFRMGVNASHLYETFENYSGSYNSVLGFQGGVVIDIARNDLIHFQPGIMFIKKGAEYESQKNGKYTLAQYYVESPSLAQYYVELPLLASLKYWAISISAGPYISLGGDKAYEVFDFGVSLGGGFDIWDFYIGAFYDNGLYNISKKSSFKTYNRTIGLNLGYNL